MKKIIKWVLIELIIFAVVITGSVILVTRFIRPYMGSESNMPKDGTFVFQQLDTGELVISWPEADKADYYIFRIYRLPNDGQLSYQNDAGKLVYEKKVTDGTSVTLRSDTFSGNMLFRVVSAVGYVMQETKQIRLSNDALELVTKFDAPSIGNLSCLTDLETGMAAVFFDMSDATVCQVSLVTESGEKKLLKTVDGNFVTFKFGEGGDFEIPAFGKQVLLHFSVLRKTDALIYYSSNFATFSIDRSMLVPSDILLKYARDFDGCRLRWEEEECDFYEIQAMDPTTGSWNVHGIVNADEELTYVITELEKNGYMVLRVAAAYEVETKGEDGKPVLSIKYRSISNEICITSEDVIPLPESERTRVSVNKIWNDEDNKNGKRPESITVNLLADGEEIAEILLNEQTGWSYTFENLYVYAEDGHEILYTITEDAVTGYTPEITGTVTEGFTLINNKDAEPEKLYGTVIVSLLRIRAGAGTDFAVVGNLSNGDRVEILETKQVGDILWGRIKQGWIAMNNVQLDEDVPKPEGKMGTVIVVSLNIRADAGTQHAVVGTLKFGDRVDILETKQVGDLLWGRIKQGWIAMNNVQMDEEEDDGGDDQPPEQKGQMGTVTTDGLRIRAGAGTGYGVLGSFNTGDRVEILETKQVGDILWGRTDKGWISMQYVKLDEESDEGESDDRTDPEQASETTE